MLPEIALRQIPTTFATAPLGMAEPSQLRRYAAQCMERAQEVADPGARAAWLEMAANWLRIAGTKGRASNIGQQQQQSQPQEPAS